MNKYILPLSNKHSFFAIKKDSISVFLLYFSVFFLGLGFHVIYVFTLFLFSATKPTYLLQPTFNKSFLINLIFISLFLLPQYTIGYHQIELDNPILSMLSVMFSIFFFGIILQQLKPNIIKNCIILLIIGIGIDALISIIYSFLTNPIVYGYGLLYNPIYKTEINSPGAALKTACLSSMLIWSMFQDFTMKRKFFFILGISALTFFALWLASRAYFVIIFIALVFSVLLNLKLKNIVRLILFGIIGLLLFTLLFQNIDISIFNRLNRLDANLESPRFLLWKDGLRKLFTHPFGGFSVDQTINKVRWFHNIFLDAGRLAGWLPVIALLLFSTYSFWLYLKKKNKFTFFAGFIFAIVFILMQQDVVVEAMVRFLVLIYFCAILLGKSRKNPTKLYSRSYK